MILAQLIFAIGVLVVSLIIILIPIFFGICIIDRAQLNGEFLAFTFIATLIEWGAILVALLIMFGK